MFFYGTSPLSALIFMMFFLPVILRVLGAMGSALTGGHAGASQVMPARQSTQEMFDAAKREYPSRMLDLDNELTLAEEFDTDLNADELKAARSHLNQAFANYSKSFGTSDVTEVNVPAARRTIDKHLAAAQRHIGLADPNSPLHNEPETPEPVAQRVETPEDELYRRFGVTRGTHAESDFVAPRVQPAARRSSVVMTPFGLMIGF